MTQTDGEWEALAPDITAELEQLKAAVRLSNSDGYGLPGDDDDHEQ